MIYADANLFVYAAIGESKSNKAIAFVENNRFQLATSPLTIDEVAWVVWRKKSFEHSALFCEGLMKSGMRILRADYQTAANALQIMREFRLKPRDAFHAATMRLNGIKQIASEDKDFDKVPWIKRVWF